ncbi:DUF4124 domain-containing protein [Undibacterium fentianense]|uniref:DUF4124 domain-containing protein n=1 Tax=Undibacterium fentianense TaxID=2828728 RepID=A0A941E055_9BURK|nr:DUF4124 domain-containing protein [Undibacterium fentianense]MBR7798567.1 DUF4124 domain-containing protein [Undibacterium fentianense]
MSRILLIISLLILISSNVVHAEAYICVDAQGKKSFSSEICSKKGLAAASNEFPVATGQAIRAKVIVPQKEVGPKLGEDGGMISADGKFITKPGQIYMSSDLPLERPVLYFLIAALIGTAGLFILFFMRFYQAHHKKLGRDD